MSRTPNLFFYTDLDAEGRVCGNFVIQPESLADVEPFTRATCMGCLPYLWVGSTALGTHAHVLRLMLQGEVSRFVTGAPLQPRYRADYRVYTLRERPADSRWAIVYSDLPDNEADFRVLDLATGEESALYPLDQCQQIVANAQQGKLLGSFGAG